MMQKYLYSNSSDTTNLLAQRHCGSEGVGAHNVLTLSKVMLSQLMFLSSLVKGKRKADAAEESVTKKAKLVNGGMSNTESAKWQNRVRCLVLTSLVYDCRILCLCWKPE